MSSMIEIKNRWTGAVRFSVEAESFKEAVLSVIRGCADLEGTYLRGVDLSGANLEGTCLRDADLEGANLKGANLKGANLKGANLEGTCLRDADLEGAYLGGADLEGAYLGGADLEGADLEGAYLGGANLKGANLEGVNLKRVNLYVANLSGAYLGGADLEGADLEGAYLGGADLKGAYLGGANLKGADLRGANLEGAYLRGADLYGARNLPPDAFMLIRNDIRAILESVPNEVGGLLQSLWNGQVEGSAYEGECACLVGTIANIRGCNYNTIPGLAPDTFRPAEQWFLNIKKGDTPVNNPAAAFAAAVIAEWMHERGMVAPVKLQVTK